MRCKFEIGYTLSGAYSEDMGLVFYYGSNLLELLAAIQL